MFGSTIVGGFLLLIWKNKRKKRYELQEGKERNRKS